MRHSAKKSSWVPYRVPAFGHAAESAFCLPSSALQSTGKPSPKFSGGAGPLRGILFGGDPFDVS